MSEPEASERGAVSTPLTELLGIRYPIVQAAIQACSGAIPSGTFNAASASTQTSSA